MSDRAIHTCPADGATPSGCGHRFTAVPDDEGLVDCPNCGLWHRPAPNLLCIGTARGVRGLVYSADGRVIGRVFKQARRLRNNAGKFGEAWTAMLIDAEGREIPCSLGTRHPDRWHAAHAIRAFWQWCERANRPATSRNAALFKYDHYATCGLTARYRGGRPSLDRSLKRSYPCSAFTM